MPHAVPHQDCVGGRDVTPWVRVWFKDRTAIEGVVPNSLVRLDVNGAVVEDLSEKQGEGIWVDVGAEVQMVEVFG